MKTTLKFIAATFAAASATWSFAAGQFWPGALAAFAVIAIVFSVILGDDK